MGEGRTLLKDAPIHMCATGTKRVGWWWGSAPHHPSCRPIVLDLQRAARQAGQERRQARAQPRGEHQDVVNSQSAGGVIRSQQERKRTLCQQKGCHRRRMNLLPGVLAKARHLASQPTRNGVFWVVQHEMGTDISRSCVCVCVCVCVWHHNEQGARGKETRKGKWADS